MQDYEVGEVREEVEHREEDEDSFLLGTAFELDDARAEADKQGEDAPEGVSRYVEEEGDEDEGEHEGAVGVLDIVLDKGEERLDGLGDQDHA